MDDDRDEAAGSCMDKVDQLVELLKLTNDTNKANMLNLLDAICEANPPYFGDSAAVQMGRPSHPNSHLVSYEGFLLLENAEAALGTTELTVEAVRLDFDLCGSLLSALASRLSRQQQKLTSVHIGELEVSSKKAAEDFKMLMQACSPRDIQVSTLEVDLGTEEGWRLLAEGLQSHPGLLEAAFTRKEPLESGRKEDLRVLWDALKPDGRLEVELEVEGRWVFVNELLEKSDGEAAWTRLCQIKDLSIEEWVAQYEESDGDAEEEDEGEEEGVEDDAKGYEGDEEDV